MARPAKFSHVLSCVLLTVLLLALMACSGGSRILQESDRDSGPTVRIALRANALDESRVQVVLEAADAADLYQLSCRLGFSPEAVRPISVYRGSLVDERAVFFTSDIPVAYVPVAFTYHPGEVIPAASGTLAVCEFELLDPGGDPNFGLITDDMFLIANDSLGRRLATAVEVGQ